MKKRTLLFCFLFWAGWMTAQQTVGLFLNDSLSVNGYVLFSNNNHTYLIDNCGKVVNTWLSNYPSTSGIYLLENGNLLRSARVNGNFNVGGSGGRIELFNWAGDLLWAYNYATSTRHQHHDLKPMPTGHILLLAWESKTQAEAIAAGRRPNTVTGGGLWPEVIVEIEPVGTDQIHTVWEWHLWDHLVQDFDDTKNNFGSVAGSPGLLNINVSGTGAGSTNVDWIHLNSIDYNPDLDQILVSSRQLSEIWIIDHSTTTEEAAGHTGGNAGKGGDFLYRWGNPRMYGRGLTTNQQLWGQHNANWITAQDHPDNGKIMAFNNGQGRPGGNYSSVDILMPPMDPNGGYLLNADLPFGPADFDWSYAADGFYAPNISGAHALPGGSTFICEGTEGRFFEITPSGQVVWEYINPVSGPGPVAQGQNPLQNSTFRATRHPADYGAFTGRDLTPGGPLELNPLPYDCTIYADSPVAVEPEPDKLQGVGVLNNPVENTLHLYNHTGQPIFWDVFDATGRWITTQASSGFSIQTDVSGWKAGVYYIRIFDAARRRMRVEKVVVW